MITLDEKIEIVERFIRARRFAHTGTDQHYDADILRAIASDLRVRKAAEAAATVLQVEQRMRAIENAKGLGYGWYCRAAQIGLANEIISRWSVIRQSLEMFGAGLDGGK